MNWSGNVEGLHSVPRSFLPMYNADTLNLIEGVGIEGDRYSTGNGFYSDRPEEGRQVTLFEAETLEALLRDHKITLRPEEHRRNMTTRGVPLNHLVGRKFRIGQVLLEGTRLSTPCRHIEQITGQEIFDLLINRSGLHARILVGGRVFLGNKIEPE
ncbi:MOSC domain-containing protein [Halomonas piscis]|uniref:MOSC domain-containing protein n=1 Tax=Halomonas piscis TaxID=3031727 RepID=UPI0028A298F0|nr:MOSC domain-containing protein [Halomonas piscis]